MARINYFEIESDSEDELPAVEELFTSTTTTTQRKPGGNIEPAVSDTSPEPSDKENEGPDSQQQDKKDQAQQQQQQQQTRPRLSTASRTPLADVTDDSLSEIFHSSSVVQSSSSKEEEEKRLTASKTKSENQEQKEESRFRSNGSSRFLSHLSFTELASDNEPTKNNIEDEGDSEHVIFEDNDGDDEEEEEGVDGYESVEEGEGEAGEAGETGHAGDSEDREDDEDENDEEDDISIPIRRKSRARAPQILLDSDEEEEVEDDIIPPEILETASKTQVVHSVEVIDDSSLFFDAVSQKSNDSVAEEETDNEKEGNEGTNWESSDHEDFADAADATDASLSDSFIVNDSEVEHEGWNTDEEDEIYESSPRRTNVIDLVSNAGTPNSSTISRTITASNEPEMTRRQFKRVREKYAQNYLDHMEDRVNGGLIYLLTGTGVNLKWSNKLRTTAGRARALRKGPYDGALRDISVRFDPENKTKYYATIELNEKVIDNPQRLADTLAHEYAHICEFLIDQKGGPYPIGSKAHGRGFKRWGKKITDAMGLEMVDRCHNYEIHYKFEWQCKGCKRSVGRQSKSIDPAIHQCSHCRGTLIQTRPAENNGSEYNKFYRENYRSVKDSMGSSATFGEVNQEVSRLWKLKKQGSNQGHGTPKDPEVIEILDDL